MRYYVSIVVVFSFILLMSCSPFSLKNKKNYETLPDLKVPHALQLQDTDPYYPVGKRVEDISGNALPAPSLVPPGSLMQQKIQSSALADASRSQTTRHGAHSIALLQASVGDGPVSLQVSKGLSATWKAMDRALEKTGYQVLDKDRSIHTYYILDIKNPDDELTPQTPIYEIYLQSYGAYTTVMLCKNNKCGSHAIPLAIQRRILTTIKSQLR